jgi:hypothetical protein
LIQENWLDAGRFKALPAVSEWSYFDDRHAKAVAFCSSHAYLFA